MALSCIWLFDNVKAVAQFGTNQKFKFVEHVAQMGSDQRCEAISDHTYTTDKEEGDK